MASYDGGNEGCLPASMNDLSSGCSLNLVVGGPFSFLAFDFPFCVLSAACFSFAAASMREIQFLFLSFVLVVEKALHFHAFELTCFEIWCRATSLQTATSDCLQCRYLLASSFANHRSQEELQLLIDCEVFYHLRAGVNYGQGSSIVGGARSGC